MAFGLGSRTCIGRNISLLEINKAIPILVRDYDFEFLNGDGLSEEKSKYIPVKNRWFVKPVHLQVHVIKRRDDV
jgi:cytochrome P450